MGLSWREIDDLIDGERWKAARERVGELLAAGEAGEPDPAERWRLRLRKVYLDFRDPEIPVDEALLTCAELIEDCPVPAELRHAFAHQIRGFGRKRAFDIVARCTQAAGERLEGEDPVVLVAQADVALQADERDEARKHFERALELSPEEPAALLGLAQLHYVLGEFERCRELVGKLPRTGRYLARGLRLEASACAAMEAFEDEIRCWRELLDAFAEGDDASDDRVQLALTLASFERYDEASEELMAAWRADPESGVGKFARARLDKLEHASKTAADKPSRHCLQAFPSTYQKWNYCGPAVLELCLRYLELELTQDEIAEVVKRERGTPMWEMVAYLKAQNIAARRVEATRDRLRAALDLGLPVIVQEEYSTTSHVAVLIGYDDRLGMFLAADPATHRPLLKSFEWTEASGALFGNGCVIVLGREGEPRVEELKAQADAAGLIEVEHLVLVDECDRRTHYPDRETPLDTTLQQSIQLCSRAIELAPDFRLAWHRRWWAMRRLAAIGGNDQARVRVRHELYDVRSRYPGEEFAHVLHGYYLLDDRRYHEAYVAFFEATLRDPGDAESFGMMGECMEMTGDLLRAEKNMLACLAREPFHVRAAENLASVYFRQLLHLDMEAKDDYVADTDPFAFARVFSRDPVEKGLERSPEELLRRARHFSDLACTYAPENPFNQQVAGLLCVRDGDHAAARTHMERALEEDSERGICAVTLAGCLEMEGLLDEAEELLRSTCERFPAAGGFVLSLAMFLQRHERRAEAGELLVDALPRLSDWIPLSVGRAYSYLRLESSAEAAATRLQELALAHRTNEDLLRTVAGELDDEQQVGHAVTLLREVVAQAPSDVGSIYRLGDLLKNSLPDREEARALLERALELAPDHPLPRRQLAWLLADEDPERGLALLEPVLDRENPYVQDARAALLERLGRHDEAARARRESFEAFGNPSLGAARLVAYHCDEYRYDQAYALCAHVDLEAIDDREDREWAEGRVFLAYRMSGHVAETLPTVQERCADGVPRHLAWEAYWLAKELDYELAAEAAEQVAERMVDEDRVLYWKIRAAGSRAKAGQPEALHALTEACGTSGAAWAALAGQLSSARLYDRAYEAAQRAIELAPEDDEALSAWEDALVTRGDAAGAIATARRLLELHPFVHQGPERLGELLAKVGEVDEALQQSEVAVTMAPYCSVAQECRAVALFCAGDLEGARRYAEQALAMAPMERPDEGVDRVLLTRALDGDVRGLERALADHALMIPKDTFPDFLARLREVASERRKKTSLAGKLWRLVTGR